MTRRRILVVSNTDDAHADRVILRLKERGIESFRLDSDVFASRTYNWRIYAADRHPSHSSWTILAIDVVWYRKVFFPEAVDTLQSFLRQEFEGLFESVLAQYRGCRWVNPRVRLAEARPKIFQLEQAKRLGFRIPDTLVTTDIEALREFAAQHEGRVVAKPIQTQVAGLGDNALVVGTRRLSPEYYESAVMYSPCYVQELLPLKSEIRVIVFGERLYPFRLTAQEKADDLKQLKLNQIRHERCDLDGVTSQKIRSLMSHYRLEFGAIDLAVIDENEPVFLELNPNGQWLWLQYMTGENLIDPFIDLLCF